MELHKRERYYIENNECVNIRIPTRTKKEYQLENKEDIKKKRAIRHLLIKEKHNLKCKEYYKMWYEKNKVERNKRRNVKINCPKCNGLIQKRSLSSHQRSNKCKKLSKISQGGVIEVK